MTGRGWPAPAAAAALGLGVALWMARGATPYIGSEPGLPLDDAWIHIRFAENMATGDLFAFNPGEPSAGSTSPLWVVLLAALSFLPGAAPARSAWASMACFALACGLAAWLARRLAGRLRPALPSPLPDLAGLAAGLGAATTGRFAWSAAAGMEVPLAAALGLAIMGVMLEPPGRLAERWGIVGLLCGLSALVRPELALLGILALAAWARDRRDARSTGGPGRGPLAAAGVAMAAVLPWSLWCLVWTGRPLPATFGPNDGGLGLPDLGYLRRAAWQLGGDQPLATLLALVGAVALAEMAVLADRGRPTPRRASLVLAVLWPVALPLAASMVAPNLRHHGRYTMPLIPVISVLAAVGGVALAGLLARRLAATTAGVTARRAGLAAALALVVLLPAAGLPDAFRWRDRYGLEAQNIHEQHEKVGRWLAAEAGPDCHVATHDIGAIATLSGCRVTDLIGLVDPGMARLYVTFPDPAGRDPEIRRLLVERGVTHVAIYPGWFPDLARDPALTPVFEARLARVASAGGPLMRVYRTPAPEPW